jgi:hypothetical protein
MKRLLVALRAILFIFFVTTAIFALIEITGAPSFLAKLNFQKPEFSHNEEFDPSLQRLDNVDKLEKYCDSIYDEGKKEGTIEAVETEYPRIASRVIRQRFYHGLSSFGFGDNYLGYILNPGFLGKHLNAPVLPDDILKHPYGICSQQALVTMKLLSNKGFITRKVGFNNVNVVGHFSFEVFYGGGWHFFDTDIEPDKTVLRAYGYPGIEFLVKNPDILIQAYKDRMDPQKIMPLFGNYFYGKPNERLATRAIAYQQITKFLSYTIWIFFLFAFIWVHRKYRSLSYSQYVRNRGVSIPYLQPG